MHQPWVIATGLGLSSARSFLEEEKKMLINSKLEWKASYDRAVTKSAKNTHLMLIAETQFSISDEGCSKKWHVLIYFQIM